MKKQMRGCLTTIKYRRIYNKTTVFLFCSKSPPTLSLSVESVIFAKQILFKSARESCKPYCSTESRTDVTLHKSLYKSYKNVLLLYDQPTFRNIHLWHIHCRTRETFQKVTLNPFFTPLLYRKTIPHTKEIWHILYHYNENNILFSCFLTGQILCCLLFPRLAYFCWYSCFYALRNYRSSSFWVLIYHLNFLWI